MGKIKNTAKMSIRGFLKITEYDEDLKNPKILLKKENAIHKEHASLLIARGIGGEDFGRIEAMSFGNGGTTILDGDINTNNPNVLVGSADLYNQTHEELFTGNTGNSITVTHLGGETYSNVIFKAIVGRGEPAGQPDTDDTRDEDYIFNEIALKTKSGTAGQLVAHVTFADIQKSANRVIEIEYTVRISVE